MIYIINIYDICYSKYIKNILYLYCSSKQSYINNMKIIIEVSNQDLKLAAMAAIQKEMSRKKFIEELLHEALNTMMKKKGGKNDK